jgi:phosphosulfolactate phosphohydrolase-like enzyme
VGARVRVLLAPTRSTAPRPGAGECAVVVDVLRATTTLTVALGPGALRVLAAATPEQASALRAGHPGALLCGERGGLRIDGFDLGNSPFEYPVPVVAGRTLIFASTNGSQALLAAAAARRRLLAAFVNARAVVERLAGERAVVIVCAGSSGRFAIEDAGCAGLLCERLLATLRQARPASHDDRSGGARTAADTCRPHQGHQVARAARLGSGVRARRGVLRRARRPGSSVRRLALAALRLNHHPEPHGAEHQVAEPCGQVGR